MEKVIHKKVELTDLFYDLVFVYAISQITQIMHHTNNGVIDFRIFFYFNTALIIYINSWMVQTVYTNRFGENSLKNILFILLQMICVLVSSTAVTGEWRENFIFFILPIAILSLILLIQYVMEYKKVKTEGDKIFISRLLVILVIRTISLMISVFLPYQIGLIVAVSGIIITWILPGILTNPKRNTKTSMIREINFPHLIERLSLLVIITFGEMIIGIAPYFERKNISVESFLIFMVVANLFIIYIVEIDHLIDIYYTKVSGNAAIYLTYFVIIGLCFIIVSLSFIKNSNVNQIFNINLLYIGIYLLMIGIMAHGIYNKESHRFTNKIYILELSLPILGYLISLLIIDKPLFLIINLFIITLIMTISIVKFNLKRNF